MSASDAHLHMYCCMSSISNTGIEQCILWMVMHKSPVCLQISYYDISRGVYDLAGQVKVTGTMGVPFCLSSAVDEKTEQENIIYGDDSGAVIMLQCGRGELPARVLKPGDFTYAHDDHTDWVTQVCLRLVGGKGRVAITSWPYVIGSLQCNGAS